MFINFGTTGSVPAYSMPKNEIAPHQPVEGTARTVQTIITALSEWEQNRWSGEKYPGGIPGIEDFLEIDYWDLRAISNTFFYKNMYARGIMDTIVTNVISGGLELEADPKASVLGIDQKQASQWAVETEDWFSLWAKSFNICDVKRLQNFGQLQKQAWLEAIVGGDCLIYWTLDEATNQPQVNIVSGDRVRTPDDKAEAENQSIVDGVHLGENGEHLGYWVAVKKDDEGDEDYVYIPRYSEVSGMEKARLIYGASRRVDSVRGEPLLSIIFQSLNEIDKYRDSTQRRAMLQSIVLAAINRDKDTKRKTKAFGTSASKTGTVTQKPTDSENDTLTPETKGAGAMLPGTVLENLEPGETIQYFNNAGGDPNFAAFEKVIILGACWVLGFPMGVVIRKFDKAFSASTAEIEEANQRIAEIRLDFGPQFCDLFYHQWLYVNTLIGNIKAKKFTESLKNPALWHVKEAWLTSQWPGKIKLSANIDKLFKTYEGMVERKWITNARACRHLTNTRYEDNVRRVAHEEELEDEYFGTQEETEEEDVVTQNDGEVDEVVN